MIWPDGTKQWWLNNERHRLDGPARKHSDGMIQWWIHGKKLPSVRVEEWLEENNVDLKTNVGQMAFKLKWI